MSRRQSVIVAGATVAIALLSPNVSRAEPELIEAFAFGSRLLDCPTANDPGFNYTMVFHGANDSFTADELQYDEDRGWGYEVLFLDSVDRNTFGRFGPFDDSPNNRVAYPDTCPSEIYDSFIGAKDFLLPCTEFEVGNPDDPCEEAGIDPEGIIFRVDLPPGFYKFVAAVGSADNRHVHRIIAEDGGDGLPVDIGPNNVVLVSNHNQAEHGAGNFARVGFGCLLPPTGDGPMFTNMDIEGLATDEVPESPTLEVTDGYIRIHQLQGNANAGAAGAMDVNGGDMVILELWKVDGPDDIGSPAFSVNRAMEPNPRAPGEAVTITLTAADITSPTTIVETIPTGWAVVDNGGGTVAGEQITFTVDASGEITYTVEMDGDACEAGTFSGTANAAGGCSISVDGDSASTCQEPWECQPTPGAAEPELIAAFHFGSRALDCATVGDPAVNFTTVLHVDGDDLSLEYDPDRGWGYDPVDEFGFGFLRFGPFDDTANNRNKFSTTCPEHMYNSFIGCKNFTMPCSELEVGSREEPCEDAGIGPEGIIFRVDLPEGKYRFAGAFGDADNVHAHRIIVENGGEGPPSLDTREDHVVLVNNFDQAQFTIGEADAAELGEGVFARVGFDDKIPPRGDGIFPSPQFVNMDEFGEATEDCPESPTLEVNEGYVRIHQLQGNSNDGDGGGRDPNGGDIVILEIWKVEDDSNVVQFRRGDPDNSGGGNITDAVAVLNHLFAGMPRPVCWAAADSNGDGAINVADPVFHLNFLFGGGPPPAAPGPDDCGPGQGQADEDLGCEEYTNC